jgi:hypothetical protein
MTWVWGCVGHSWVTCMAQPRSPLLSPQPDQSIPPNVNTTNSLDTWVICAYTSMSLGFCGCFLIVLCWWQTMDTVGSIFFYKDLIFLWEASYTYVSPFIFLFRFFLKILWNNQCLKLCAKIPIGNYKLSFLLILHHFSLSRYDVIPSPYWEMSHQSPPAISSGHQGE